MEILENGNIKIPYWEVVFWIEEKKEDAYWGCQFKKIRHFLHYKDADEYTYLMGERADVVLIEEPVLSNMEFKKPTTIQKDSPEWHAWCQERKIWWAHTWSLNGMPGDKHRRNNNESNRASTTVASGTKI